MGRKNLITRPPPVKLIHLKWCFKFYCPDRDLLPLQPALEWRRPLKLKPLNRFVTFHIPVFLSLLWPTLTQTTVPLLGSICSGKSLLECWPSLNLFPYFLMSSVHSSATSLLVSFICQHDSIFPYFVEYFCVSNPCLPLLLFTPPLLTLP